MAQDYKRRSRRKPPTPAWVWFSSGLALGLCVALGVHLYHGRAQAPERRKDRRFSCSHTPSDRNDRHRK